MPRTYVASSWRNPYYEQVVRRLREEGHEVYDFRNPPHGGAGFHWTDVDENAPNWTFEEYAGGGEGAIRLPSVSSRPIWTPWSGLTPACWYFLAAAALTLKPDGWRDVGGRSLSIFPKCRSRS